MKKVELFLEFMSEKLAALTGFDETFSFIIVLVVCGLIIRGILKWLFGGEGNQEKKKEKPIHRSSYEERNRIQQEADRREKDRIERDQKAKERAAEVGRLEILEGRRRNEGW